VRPRNNVTRPELQWNFSVFIGAHLAERGSARSMSPAGNFPAIRSVYRVSTLFKQRSDTDTNSQGILMIRQDIDAPNYQGIGHRLWAIPEGFIPGESVSTDRELISHEAACILNTCDEPAKIEITVYFRDRDPIGPYRSIVPGRRTLHLRFNDLVEPHPIPRDTAYASVIRASVPVVVQYTRLDSRHPNISLLSTIAFPVGT
jgi:hypothetical protein